jgi:hypothetical protein
MAGPQGAVGRRGRWVGGGRVLRSLPWAVLVGLALLAGACRGQPAGGAPRLAIESPNPGATVTSPIQLVLDVQGVGIGPPESGLHHFHVYVDGGGDYEVVTDVRSSLALPAGQHTLRVVLARPNHDETGTSATVTVTVASGGASPSPTRRGYYP